MNQIYSIEKKGRFVFILVLIYLCMKSHRDDSERTRRKRIETIEPNKQTKHNRRPCRSYELLITSGRRGRSRSRRRRRGGCHVTTIKTRTKRRSGGSGGPGSGRSREVAPAISGEQSPDVVSLFSGPHIFSFVSPWRLLSVAVVGAA